MIHLDLLLFNFFPQRRSVDSLDLFSGLLTLQHLFVSAGLFTVLGFSQDRIFC